jgi:hypothetical protein
MSIEGAWEALLSFLPKFEGLLARLVHLPKSLDGWALMAGLRKIEHVEPAAGLDNATRAFAMHTAAGMMASMAAALSEISIAGCKLPGLGHIAGFLGRFSGWDGIIRAVLGPAYFGAMELPLRYWINSQLTPWLPQPRELIQMRYQDIIKTDEELNALLAYHGYTADWAKKLFQVADRKPSIRDLGTIAEGADLDEDFVSLVLKQSAYDPEYIPVLADGITRRTTKGYRYQLINVWLEDYEAGRIDADKLTTLLTDLEVPPGRRAAILDLAAARHAAAWTKAQVSLLDYRYQRDELDDLEYYNALLNAGLTPNQARLKADTVKVLRYKTVSLLGNQEIAAQALDAAKKLWRLGEIGDSELLGWLVQANVHPQAADVILQAMKAQAAASSRKP